MDRLTRFVPGPVGAAVVVTLASFVVYSGALSNGLVYDDVYLALDNPWIRDLQHIPAIFTSPLWSFEFDYPQNYYRPVIHLIYMAAYQLSGFEAWGYHLAKVLLHAGSALFVFLIASIIFASTIFLKGSNNKIIAALAAALLFTTHPILTESVTVGVAELAFAFFFLVSFWFYIKKEDGAAIHSTVSIAAFFLATLSKETALMLPAVLIAYDYCIRRKDPFSLKSAKRYIPYAVVIVIYFILRANAIGGVLPPQKVHGHLSNYEYFINIFPLFSGYLWKLIMPTGLNAAYVFHPVSSVLEWKTVLGIAATMGFAASVYLARRKRVVMFSLLWVAIPLLPALYIPALGEHTFAERYLYLPTVGFAMLILTGLNAAASKGWFGVRPVRVVLPTVLAITLLYSAGTAARVPVWRSDVTLWTDTVRKSPDSFMAHNSLGNVYSKQGRIDEAVSEFKESIRLKPNFAEGHYNLGATYENHGRIDDAIEAYKDSIRVYPDFAAAHNNLGILYGKKGMLDMAEKELLSAIRFKKDYAEAHSNLGLVYYMLGRTGEAVEEYRLALSLDPDEPKTHYNLGIAYQGSRRTEDEVKAIAAYTEALRLKPDYAKAHNNLGSIYEGRARYDRAEEHYRAALRIKTDFPEARFNLGVVFMKKGFKAEAAVEFKKVLAINPGHTLAREALGALKQD